MTKMWFKRKKYGWGWTPITIEGWLVIGALIAFAYYVANYHTDKIFTYLGSAVIIVIYIGYMKGPKPKWSWG